MNKLTPIESKLYQSLCDHEFHTAKSLQLEVIGRRYASPSVVPTHINRLKKKIAETHLIEHTTGRGYRLTEKSRGQS